VPLPQPKLLPTAAPETAPRQPTSV
jgi:hypothetical protein